MIDRRSLMLSVAGVGLVVALPAAALSQTTDADKRLDALLTEWFYDGVDRSPTFATSLGIDKDERAHLAGKLGDRVGRSRIVVLDERGTNLTTLALAARLKDWQLGGDDVALVIGGPDGIEPEFRKAAHERIRLSDMTLPHAFARVLLIEQLYRAWSVNANHPYHRE